MSYVPQTLRGTDFRQLLTLLLCSSLQQLSSFSKILLGFMVCNIYYYALIAQNKHILPQRLKLQHNWLMCQGSRETVLPNLEFQQRRNCHLVVKYVTTITAFFYKKIQKVIKNSLLHLNNFVKKLRFFWNGYMKSDVATLN